MIQINQYQYPIGWEWLHRITLEDWQWLIDVFATLTDNTDTYEYARYLTKDGIFSNDREEIFYYEGKISSKDTNYVNWVDTPKLAEFMNNDQGYEGGIREYGHYIAAKTLGIKSEEEFLKRFNEIELICNEI